MEGSILLKNFKSAKDAYNGWVDKKFPVGTRVAFVFPGTDTQVKGTVVRIVQSGGEHQLEVEVDTKRKQNDKRRTGLATQVYVNPIQDMAEIIQDMAEIIQDMVEIIQGRAGDKVKKVNVHDGRRREVKNRPSGWPNEWWFEPNKN
jgi:hypothetical protein